MQKRISLILSIVTILVICAGSAFAQNLVTNGTFDAGNITGWTNVGTAEIHSSGDFGMPASPQGGKFCGMITNGTSGTGSISQTVTLTGQGVLSLDLYAAAHMDDGNPARPGYVNVSWNGTQIIHYSPSSGTGWAGDSAWIINSLPVTGIGANTLLISWGANSAAWTWTCVDNVSVVALPPVSITAGPTVSLSGTNSAIVTWTTNVASDSSLGYGIGNTNTVLSSSALTTSHSLTITGLSVDAVYTCQVTSAASGYAAGTKSGSFIWEHVQSSLQNGGFEAVTTPVPPAQPAPVLAPWYKFNIDPTGDVNGINYDFDDVHTYASTVVNPHSGFQFAGALSTFIRKSRTGILQRVATVPGQTYGAQAWVQTVHSPDTNIYCIPPGDYNNCGVRIGVDPTGNTDPQATTVQWDYADNQPGSNPVLWYNDIWACTQTAPWTCGVGWVQNGWTLITSPAVTASSTSATVFVQVLQKYTYHYDACEIDDVAFGNPSAVTTPGQVKAKATNWAVTLGGGEDPSTTMYVTYVDPTSTFCYIEAGDRSSGIRVDVPNPNTVTVGDIVQVSGQTALDGGESCIHPVNGPNPYTPINPVMRIGVDLDNTIKPLALSNGATGGAAFGIQSAVGGGAGVPPTGLLVTVSGKFVEANNVTAGSLGPFWIDDGCQQDGGVDSNSTPVVGLKCYLNSERANFFSNHYIVVTGVVGMEAAGTGHIPVIYIRSDADVQDLGEFTGPGQ